MPLRPALERSPSASTGANFIPGSVVNWNYQPRVTTYVSGHEIQAQILASDVQSNTAGYISVTNPAPGGGSSSASWAQVEVHDPILTISLGSPVFYAFGDWSLQAADFTHQGILDLVGEYYGLAYDRGLGDGTFTSGPIISAGFAQTTTFAYGDFNNDGNLDVVMDMGGTQEPPDIIHMAMYFGNGQGAFTKGPTITARSGFGLPVAGDFNRDGNLDLVTSGTKEMLEFLGSGNGTFHSPTGYPYGLLAKVMQVGDFNNDGKLDLILSGPAFLGYGQTVWFMQGNGDGTFVAPKEILSATDTNGCGFSSQLTLQLSDFNRDGNLDLAFCTKSGVGVMLGNGDGTFGKPSFFTIDTAGAGQFSFAVGDINSDGKQDFFVSEYSNYNDPQLAIYLGNGDGTFQPPQMLNITQAELGIVTGDYNSDGLLDLILLSGGGMDVALQN